MQRIVPALLLSALLALLAAPSGAQQEALVQPTLKQLRELRAVLAPFEDVKAATAAGYEQATPCMSGPQGAMGIHFINGGLFANPALDPLRPEALMYEPRRDGTLRLVGAEYLVFQAAWHAAGNKAPPALLGQEFHLNTTLLDEPFYLLHVWVWQYNPLGLFANWNPLVACPGATSHSH